MDRTTFVYTKERRQFGRSCIFTDINELIFNETSNKELFSEYILKNPVSCGTQIYKSMSLNIVNTFNTEYKKCGVNHIEGGWPKDINLSDPEQVLRYRKKMCREDNYVQQVHELSKPMLQCVQQNSAVNIYEIYFAGLDPAPLPSDCIGRTVNKYKDPMSISRPITHLSWSPDGGRNIVGSYCDSNFLGTHNDEPNSFVWNIENPNLPLLTLTPKSPAISIEFNAKDNFVMVGGLMSGQVAIWDTRTGGNPIQVCEREIGHRERVNSVLWTTSKTNSEFYSGSSDGRLYWWDTRKLNQPFEELFLDPIKTDDQIQSRSFGASVLEFESTLATRFMVGTEQGYVFSCNRKGKTPTEKILTRIPCHKGRIYALERNPTFVKNFLTVGDWSARIWTEECKDSAIIWIKNHPVPLLSGTWSSTRCSLFYLTREDGVLDVWDLLVQQKDPVLSLTICDSPLLCIKGHDNGKLIATGAQNGSIYLIQVSDNMAVGSKNDRPLFTMMLDRETKREKILEAKMREVKLKMKQEEEHRRQEQPDDENRNIAPIEEQETDDTELKPAVKKDPIALAEDDFLELVRKERERRKKIEANKERTEFEKALDADEIRQRKLREIKKKVVRGFIALAKQQQSKK